jgi:hypothetical protein
MQCSLAVLSGFARDLHVPCSTKSGNGEEGNASVMNRLQTCRFLHVVLVWA